jgi:hypothetical protein
MAEAGERPRCRVIGTEEEYMRPLLVILSVAWAYTGNACCVPLGGMISIPGGWHLSHHAVGSRAGLGAAARDCPTEGPSAAIPPR